MRIGAILLLTLVLNVRGICAQYTLSKIADTASTPNIQFSGIAEVVINSAGTVAFNAVKLDGQGHPVGSVILAGSGGALTTVAEAGSSPTLLRLSSINSSGTIVYTARNADLSAAVYTWSSGVTSAVAPLPQADPSESADINDGGVVVFTKVGDIVESSNGSLRTIDPGNFHNDFGLGQINRSGSVVFYGITPDFAIQTDTNGVVKSVVSGAANIGEIMSRPATNDAGSVAWVSLVVSGATYKSVVNRIDNGQPTIISGGQGAFGTVNLNNAGSIALTRLSATGGSIAGIYTGPDPVADKVIAVGDAAFGSTVTGIFLGNAPGRFLNDSGQICFEYVLSNGTLGIAVATPVSVGVPNIKPGGVVPVFSSSATIQPGSWISIYGSNLAPSTTVWDGTFPTSLSGTSVTINSKPAYIWFVSPNQINVQAPDDNTAGPVPVVVTTAAGTATSSVTLAPVAPSFSLLDSRHVTAIIIRQDKSGAYGGGAYDILGPTGTALGYPTVAARAGDVVALFGVGFGPTNPSVFAGKVFSGSAPLTNTVNITIGATIVNPVFAGLTSAGLYQINIVIPSGLTPGDLPLSATVAGKLTPGGVVLSVE